MGDPDRYAIRELQDLDPFQPHPACLGGWLQTLSIKAQRPDLDVESWPGCQPFSFEDDRTPPDTLSGFFLPVEEKSNSRATVILLHGMGGHARSGYMRSAGETLLKAGHPVILWNHRGAGDSAANCAGLHHPGYTDDLRRLVAYLHEQRGNWCDHGLHCMAYSLGANLLLKYLAEAGRESGFDAAVSVSAPLDMAITSRNLQTGLNRLFDRYLLYRQKAEIIRERVSLSDEERDRLREAKTVWQLDDQFTSKRFGYQGAEEFYRDNSSIHVLDQIATPTLLIHAEDDPVVDEAVFGQWDWQPKGPLYPALLSSGGHTGFLSSRGTRWHEQAAIAFFKNFG